MALRVVQWTTGNVGKQSAIAIANAPGLELVGCYAWSPDKVGRDVGELCGVHPLGVKATNDVQALLALHPDCGFAPGSAADIPIDEAYQKLCNEVRAAETLRRQYG